MCDVLSLVSPSPILDKKHAADQQILCLISSQKTGIYGSKFHCSSVLIHTIPTTASAEAYDRLKVTIQCNYYCSGVAVEWASHYTTKSIHSCMYVYVHICICTYTIEEKEAINLKASREEKEGRYDKNHTKILKI